MKKAEPTGTCWCGCGQATKPGRFFVQNHDRKAEAAVIRAEYGSIPNFLVAHGYDQNGKNHLGKLKR